MTSDSNVIERVELYIWWVKNCSQEILPNQIKKESAALIEELEKIKKITCINYSSLEFLYKLRFFNFDVLKVEECEAKRRRSIAYFFA
jgi:hypothetical protein